MILPIGFSFPKYFVAAVRESTTENGFCSTWALLPVSSGKENAGSNQGRRYMAIPLKNLHTYADIDKTNQKYLKLFPLVAGMILLLAIFNYISLTTARSSVRSKEIGVRKVLGASRGNLTLQFFLESTLYTTIAFALGYLLCLVFQPLFFRFLQIPIDSSFLYHPAVLHRVQLA